MKLATILIAICEFANLSMAYVLPSEIGSEPCQANDPNLDECLLQKLRAAQPYLTDGIPDIAMIPLDPLRVARFLVNGNVRDAFLVNATLTNVEIKGIRNALIEQTSFDPANLQFTVKVFFPAVECEMEYDIDGRMLGLPLKNKGYIVANASDIVLEATSNLIVRTRKNQERHFKIKEMTVKSRVGSLAVKMISKDPRFQEIADTIVDFVNNNSRVALDVANPLFVQAAAEALTSFFNPALSRIPVRELID